jgi:hypothetical protein
MTQVEKARAFEALHAAEPFLIPRARSASASAAR